MTTTKTKGFTILLCVVASQATLLYSFGYDMVVVLLSTPTTMEEDLGMTENEGLHFRNATKWLFFVACFVSGFVADFLGRRSTLILSGTLSFVGFLIMSLAVSYGVLIAGRIISLVGIGLGLPVAPLYIGEVAPPSRRGFLNSIPEVFWCLGIFLAVVTRAAVRDLSASSQWRGLVGVAIVPSLILGVGMILMLESPSWLVRRARVADAKATLQRTLKTSEEVDERLLQLRTAARILPTIGDENFEAIPQDIQVLAILQEIRRPATNFTLKVLFLSNLTPHLVQPMAGTDLLTYESVLKFGLHGPFAPMDFLLDQLPFLFGRLLPILFPMLVSDVIGRRKLIWLSMVLVTVSMVAMNVSFMALDHRFFDSGVAERMSKWSMVAVFGSFSLGLGPMTWVHTSEVLPFKVRAQLIGMTVVVNRLICLGLTYLKPITDRWTKDLLFLILNLVLPYMGQRLCRKHLMETRGKSLEVTDLLISPTLDLNLGHVRFNF
ncbi:unnamed protein product [Linum trigynum]|uniref:Major facilitator superfamily (MFS) profile domain-containing protein n=1 Tax=Linum trigynum TaxID=586398 RepID=A0AAV2EKD9_9ROSI